MSRRGRRRERPQKSFRFGNGAGKNVGLRNAVIGELNDLKAEFNKSCENCKLLWFDMVDSLPEILEGADIPEVEFTLSEGFYLLQCAMIGQGQPLEVGDQFTVFQAEDDEYEYAVVAAVSPEYDGRSGFSFCMVPLRKKRDEVRGEVFIRSRGWIKDDFAD